MSVKQYQDWVSHYLVSRRDGDHALACELAVMVSNYWKRQGNTAEHAKWRQRQEDHRQRII